MSDPEQPLLSVDDEDTQPINTASRPQTWTQRFLPASTWQSDNEDRQQLSLSRGRVLFGGFCILILLILAFIAGYRANYSKSSLNPKSSAQAHEIGQSSLPQWEDCGATVEDALARNCTFDTLSFVWQISDCYDGELISEWEAFVRENNWQYFEDRTAKRPVSLELAFSGRYDLWVMYDLHRAHCTFAWRQMHRAYSERGFIDSHLSPVNHTRHCQGVMLEEHHSRVAYTSAMVKFPKCQKIIR